jgi:hypothetical protein
MPALDRFRVLKPVIVKDLRLWRLVWHSLFSQMRLGHVIFRGAAIVTSASDSPKSQETLPIFFHGRLLSYEKAQTGTQWSGFDILYPVSRELAKRMSNPKLHWKPIFATGPLILTFAREPAEKGCEC